MKSSQFSIDVKKQGGYSYEETYSFLHRYSNHCLHHAEDGMVTKLLEIRKQLFLVQLSEGAPDQLIVNVLNTSADKLQQEEISQYIRRWLGLNTDLVPFYSFARKDLVLRQLTDNYPGVRVIGIPDLFEAISWAIIGQQINLTFAFKLKQRFVERFGRNLDMDGNIYYLHPDTMAVAGSDPEDYASMQFTRKKGEYLITVAQAIEQGTISEEKLGAMDFADAHRLLCSIRGIGNWTANYVLLKCFHHPAALPVEDAGLLNALKTQYKLEKKPSFEEARTLTAHWGDHASLATFYMWRSLVP